MKAVITVILLSFLAIFFLHVRRINHVNSIGKQAIASIDQHHDLNRALGILSRMDAYEGHQYLRPRIQALRESFFERLADDMIQMAENREYRPYPEYHLFVIVPYLVDCQPQPSWLPERFAQLAEIALSQGSHYLTVSGSEKLDEGKELYVQLVGIPHLTQELRDRIEFIRSQCAYRWIYEYFNWEGKVRMEMRNGIPYYYE